MNWNKCLNFMVREAFGEEGFDEWKKLTEGDKSFNTTSLEGVKEGETVFDDVVLSEDLKDLFLVTEASNQKSNAIKSLLEGKPINGLTDLDKALISDFEGMQRFGGAFRTLFFAFVFKLYPQTKGPWAMSIRKDFKVVKGPMPKMNIQPDIIPVKSIEELQGMIKLIKGGKMGGGIGGLA